MQEIVMYCKYCGKKISDNSKFCSYCGKSLIKIKNDKSGNQCATVRDEEKHEIVPVEQALYLEDKSNFHNNEKKVKKESTEDSACL
ncbi:MAG: zinc ribbon domain-containing protein, partial [Treponema sp.]|nr:zinc ribbon domain-containing protein [Treponema sp.]